jgi:hypothetical protein
MRLLRWLMGRKRFKRWTRSLDLATNGSRLLKWQSRWIRLLRCLSICLLDLRKCWCVDFNLLQVEYLAHQRTGHRGQERQSSFCSCRLAFSSRTWPRFPSRPTCCRPYRESLGTNQAASLGASPRFASSRYCSKMHRSIVDRQGGFLERGNGIQQRLRARASHSAPGRCACCLASSSKCRIGLCRSMVSRKVRALS